jgi:hypothetical protein
MCDETETIRREMVATINADPGSRPDLEAKHGQVWDTSELQNDYQVLGFMAPFVVVRRRSDGIKGSLMFQHSPRLCEGSAVRSHNRPRVCREPCAWPKWAELRRFGRCRRRCRWSTTNILAYSGGRLRCPYSGTAGQF